MISKETKIQTQYLILPTEDDVTTWSEYAFFELFTVIGTLTYW